QVWRLTFHRRRDFKNKSQFPGDRVAKFFPRKDGPWVVTHANAERSSYTLDVPNESKFNTFHISELAPFTPNNAELFPSRELQRPGPIVTEDGFEEFFIEEIIDEKGRGKRRQCLVRWRGYGPEEDT
ncbi:hypothetical protein BDZ89DRAFT_953130, partial [Hymenopellis radicata]